MNYMFSDLLKNHLVWLINNASSPIRKTADGFKHKVLSPFKTNTPEECSKQAVYRSGNRPSKLKIHKQCEDNIIKCIRNLFKLKKENETIKDNN